MVKVSPEVWARMVTAYRDALAATEAAGRACEAEPLPANDKDGKSALEVRWLELGRVSDELAQRLLTAEAPHLAAVALQLELFAARYHAATLSEPSAGENAEAKALRRIWKALVSLSPPTG